MSAVPTAPNPSESFRIRNKGQALLLWLAVLIPLLAPAVAMCMLWGRWVGWIDVGLLFGMYILCGLGITVGYHRMLTHRSFEAHPIAKFTFLALGAMSGMGPPLIWAITHIHHHACSDDDGDPHSPWDWVDRARKIRKTGFRQFNRAHVLWVVYGDSLTGSTSGQWLRKDSMVTWLSRWDVYTAILVLGFVIPFLIGGWQGLIWGGIVRMGLTHHVTWSINSVCHIYGRRSFDTPDCSKNNWIFGVVGFGEGWHNNHHAFPRSAFHGLRWWQIDTSGYVIRCMELLGLAKAVWRVPKDKLRNRLAVAEASRNAP